ncbi:MAG: LamG domain-containing protein, partial [Planctomycetota bacterium]
MSKKLFVLMCFVLLPALSTQTFGELLQNASFEDYNEGQWGYYDPGWPYPWGAWGATWSWYGDGMPYYEYDDPNYPAFAGRACVRMAGAEYATWEQRLDLDSDWVEGGTYYWGFWVRDMREGGSPDAISSSVFYFKDGNEYDGENLSPNLRFHNEQYVPADGQYHYIETDFNIPSGYDIDEIKLLFFKMWDGEYLADYAYIGYEPRPAPRFARNPVPADGSAQDLSVSTLSWTNAEPNDPCDTVTVDVYFLDAGTSPLSVEPDLGPGVVDPEAIQLADDEAISSVALPSPVEIRHHYYWAVHTNAPNSGGTAVTIPAIKTWHFYIDYNIVVEDFDSYARHNDLRDVWGDFWTNGTGSDAYVEKSIVRDGNSLLFGYSNNSEPYYSEIEAETANLSAGSDFTASSVKSLSLWFYGQEDNDANEQMYLVLEDSGSDEAVIYYDGDMNDIKTAEWQEWNIDLNDFTDTNPSLDLTNTAKIYIGFGDRSSPVQGGNGEVYFEDIRLYPLRCLWGVSHGHGDATGDCIIDGYDLEIMAQDWLIRDYNTLGYPGTLIGFDDPDGAWSEETADGNGSLYFPAIVDVNGDLYCDGAVDHSPDAYSHVETVPLGITSNTVTMTAWIKTDGLQCDWSSGIVFMRPPATGMNIFGDELCYHWNDQHWSWRPGLFVPLNTWTFVALVVSPDGARLYMNEAFEDDSTGADWDPVEFAEPIWLGQDWVRAEETRNFRGWIDDVRIYDFSLDVSEIEHVRTFGGSGTGPATGPISWYKLDETSGIKTADSCGQTVYWPVSSKANLVDPEPQYQRSV